MCDGSRSDVVTKYAERAATFLTNASNAVGWARMALLLFLAYCVVLEKRGLLKQEKIDIIMSVVVKKKDNP